MQKFSDLQDWMKSDNRELRSEAYYILTDANLRRRVDGFEPSVDQPLFCLEYLLECIYEEDENAWDTTHSRAEALWELGVPFAQPYWETVGAQLPTKVYWERISETVRSFYPNYVDAIVTHFLEGAYNLPGFSETMSDWKKDEKLVKYVVETEMIIGPCT